MRMCALFLGFLPGLSGCSAEGGRDAVTVRVLDWAATQELVASKKVKVVVVDVWATTCAPCLRELPGLVKLHQRWGKEKLACVSVSCDYLGMDGESPESHREAVLRILQSRGALFDNVLLSNPSDDFFQMADLASIPAVYVYDREGKLVKRFDNETGEFGDSGFTYEKHISPLVEKLLARK